MPDPGRATYAGEVTDLHRATPAPVAEPAPGTSAGRGRSELAVRLADRVVDLLVALVARVRGWLAPVLGRPASAAWAWALARLGLRRDVVTSPSAVGMRRLAVAGVVANGFIVVSGGLVRVTKSGLGCPTWPRCTAESLLPAPHVDVPVHQMLIEFGNRTLTFVLLAVGVLVLVAAVGLRARRPDLARLAVVQPLGILAQGVLGGITVLSGLHPAVVGAHYLLSSLVLVACVVLLVRAGEGDRVATPTVGPLTTRLATALPYAGFVLLMAGTVVTGAGPHAGDADAERYAFVGARTVEVAARVHSLAMWATLALVGALLVVARRDPAAGPTPSPRARFFRRRTWLLVWVVLGQGLVGYVQYFTGVPEGLVLLHIAGSVLFWVAVLLVRLAVRDRGPLVPDAAALSR